MNKQQFIGMGVGVILLGMASCSVAKCEDITLNRMEDIIRPCLPENSAILNPNQCTQVWEWNTMSQTPLPENPLYKVMGYNSVYVLREQCQAWKKHNAIMNLEKWRRFHEERVHQ